MFVVFEGIDGSGKTTISNRVAALLRTRGLSVSHLRADGKFASPVSEAIRELGRDAKNLELVPQAEFLLYVARDVQLIEQVLKPALATKDVVFGDRFLFTPEVLGRYGRHLPSEWTGPILAQAAGGITPDLVILVDVDPALARARRKSAKLANRDERPPARKGLSGVGLQHRVRAGYLMRASETPERWVVVDNDDDLDDIVERVADLVAAGRESVASAIAAFREDADARRTRELPSVAATTERALEALVRWVERRSVREPRVAAYVLSGLFGEAVDGSRRALARDVPDAVLAGSTSLADDVSWELRAELVVRHPRPVAASLRGVSPADARAGAMRQRLVEDAPFEIALSLEGLDDDASWNLRERLYASHPCAVMASLAGVDSERARALRATWLEENAERMTRDDAIAQAAAASVTGLDDDGAWKIRERAWTRTPVAALASLEGLTSARSWVWRERYLANAPKIVMGTLAGVRVGESWHMRLRVVADCKEAIDSIDGLDDEEAWTLREMHLDTWPSTVVKSLGALADAPRGQDLVSRQLRYYPQNLSLLKHSAGIALGVHRKGSPREDRR
ncbi:MAG TPA: dTMP kinase [Polyangiaceae bacterium]|nr:dTMP kinase [Polyangiaceae bacterium]